MAQYPSLLPTFSTKTNEVDEVDARHVNLLQDEIIALSTNIGTTPQGTQSNFMARYNAMHNGSGYLYSTAGDVTPTAPGQFWYDSTAEQMKFIKPDGTRLSIGGGLSNVI